MIIVDFLTRLFHDMPGTLESLSATMGPWFYIVLFAIIFCETGLIVTPFLPGDSLLFAAGAVCALPGAGLNVYVLGFSLMCAALLGDTVNYNISRWAARKFIGAGKIPYVKEEHLARTNEFFVKHGGRTIILARFLPIIRTYAPFVAGAAAMPRKQFFTFSVIGAVVWISIFLGLGYGLGNHPAIRENFKYVIFAILIISVAPAVIEFLRARKARSVT